MANNVPARPRRPVLPEPARSGSDGRPGEDQLVPLLYSDKALMDNPEGDRRILRRAHQLADERNRRTNATVAAGRDARAASDTPS